MFLLSRVREESERTGDNGLAVADGLAATARVITAAAAIMVAVFLSFVLGDQRLIKLFGLGLASAIFIDATVVRMVLVPSVVELLGPANWCVPHWLDRGLPSLAVDVSDPTVAAVLADEVDLASGDGDGTPTPAASRPDGSRRVSTAPAAATDTAGSGRRVEPREGRVS